jgi:hypothetical protein
MKEATYQMSECSEKVHAKVSRDKEVISPASYVVILFVCEVMDHNRRRSRTKKAPHPKHLPPGNHETVVIAHMSRMAHNSSAVSVSSACEAGTGTAHTMMVAHNSSQISA